MHQPCLHYACIRLAAVGTAPHCCCLLVLQSQQQAAAAVRVGRQPDRGNQNLQPAAPRQLVLLVEVLLVEVVVTLCAGSTKTYLLLQHRPRCLHVAAQSGLSGCLHVAVLRAVAGLTLAVTQPGSHESPAAHSRRFLQCPARRNLAQRLSSLRDGRCCNSNAPRTRAIYSAGSFGV